MIEGSIQRDALKGPLKAIKKVADRKADIPILANVVIEDVDGETVTIRATDLDRWLVYRVPGTIDGACTVPAAILADFVAKLPATMDAVSLKPARDNTAVRVSASRYRTTLPALTIEDAPALPHMPELPITVDGQSLAAALAFVNVAVGVDETRYYLQGVHFRYVKLDPIESKDGARGHAAVLVLTATDGKIMAQCRVAVQPADIPPDPVIVPREAIDAIIDVAHRSEARLTLSGSFALCETDYVDVYSKLIDGTYPDVERVVPKSSPVLFTVQQSEIDAAIDAAIATVGKSGFLTITFKRNSKTARMDARSADKLIDFEADIAIEHPERGNASSVRSVTLSVSYLSGLIDAFAALSVPAVTFCQRETGEPVLLLPPDDFVGVKTLIMPIRDNASPPLPADELEDPATDPEPDAGETGS